MTGKCTDEIQINTDAATLCLIWSPTFDPIEGGGGVYVLFL
jgi:hypothetical protein